MSLEDKIEMGIFGKIFKHGKGIAAAAAIASSVGSAPAVAENSATYSPTSSSSYTQQQFNFEKIPPGLRPELTTEEFVFPVLYEELNGMRNNFDHDQIALILKGGAVGGFHMKFNYDKNGNALVGSIPPAMKCDGGYAYLNALWAIKENRYRRVITPASYLDPHKLNKQSPSMRNLILGMESLFYGDYEDAEPRLITSIFTNVYGESLGKRKTSQYLSEPNTQESIIEEANKIISNMKFSQKEYKKCDPQTESTRLMLAQWGAWALTNTLVRKMEITGDKSKYKLALDINLFERNFSEKNKIPKIRAKNKNEYYVSTADTKNFDF